MSKNLINTKILLPSHIPSKTFFLYSEQKAENLNFEEKISINGTVIYKLYTTTHAYRYNLSELQAEKRFSIMFKGEKE